MRRGAVKTKRVRADEAFAKASAAWEAGRLREALRLFLFAAKLGGGSDLNIGYFYDVGLGVKRNRAKAMRWYMRAYRQHDLSAANNIGTIYRDDGDVKRALEWFGRAIRMGDADASVVAAKMLLREKGREAEIKRYLERALKAREDDITEGGRDEAERILNRLERRKRGGR
jgi:TPR repeat protein